MTGVPADARPASTVVVLRPAARDAYEVLLVRRNDKVAFMGGAFVFPGGRVDAADHDPGHRAGFLSAPARFADISPEEELPYRVAAVRELSEEASLAVTIDDLLPIAHWVTPEIEIRRYDTRFFLTVLPQGQQARHDEGETTELAWLTPVEALEKCRQGDIRLPPPTWTTLRQLEAHSTLEAALDWARNVRIVRVMPGFEKGERESMLTLPGDPLYPTIDGWIVPEETRFILEEGKGWLPTRP
jgi:8-oxo-dGTP pyrophosphatase MutT (NUDIX family)